MRFLRLRAPALALVFVRAHVSRKVRVSAWLDRLLCGWLFSLGREHEIVGPELAAARCVGHIHQ
jgi:hypothetical protein